MSVSFLKPNSVENVSISTDGTPRGCHRMSEETGPQERPITRFGRLSELCWQ